MGDRGTDTLLKRNLKHSFSLYKDDFILIIWFHNYISNNLFNTIYMLISIIFNETMYILHNRSVYSNMSLDTFQTGTPNSN